MNLDKLASELSLKLGFKAPEDEEARLAEMKAHLFKAWNGGQRDIEGLLVDALYIAQTLGVSDGRLRVFFDRLVKEPRAGWEEWKRIDCDQRITSMLEHWESCLPDRKKPAVEKEPCDACADTGVLFPHGDDTGYCCIERCDLCGRYGTDDEAALQIANILIPRDEGYCVTYATLPGRKWEELGSARIVVLQWLGGSHAGAFFPISFEEGVTLARKIEWAGL